MNNQINPPTLTNVKMCVQPTKKHVICIPRMDAHIPKSFIFKTFCAMKIGFIESVHEMPIKNDPDTKRVFVYVKWNHSENAQAILNRFDDEQNVKVVYSFPWYWICVSKQ
jgi:hypothetical protein